MYESVPQPRRIYSAPQDDWDEDDYDVFLFYPSRYRAFQCPRARLSWEWDGYDASSGTSECIPSPTYSYDEDFVFPDISNDVSISDIGYSRIFRTGLLGQHSCRISGRLTAFIAKTMGALRSLKARLSRPLARGYKRYASGNRDAV